MLTKRQRDLLTHITAEINAGRKPSYRAMASAQGLRSCGSLYVMVSNLIERGHLHRHNGELKLGPRIMWMRFDDDTKTLIPLKRKRIAA